MPTQAGRVLEADLLYEKLTQVRALTGEHRRIRITLNPPQALMSRTERLLSV